VNSTWLGWWHGQFPCEHPQYMYIFFMVGCFEPLYNKHFHHHPIYFIILQAIIISPSFNNCMHLYIYNLEIISFYHWEHPNVVVLMRVFNDYFSFFYDDFFQHEHSIFSIINFSVQLHHYSFLHLYCSTIYCKQWCFSFPSIIDLSFLLTIIHVLWFRG
jgi:hypothetical protein